MRTTSHRRSIIWMLSTGFLIMMFTIAGCATPLVTLIERIKPGMDKADVLDIAGNPKRTLRDNGRDRWTYLYFQGEQPLEREVLFEGGRVLSVSVAQPPRAGAQEDSDPLSKDLEALAKEKAKTKSTP